MKAIVATNRLGYIGKDDKMLWYNKKDLQHFKKMTLNCKIIVGRVTYDSLPVLKNRELIIVGRNYNSLEQAIKKADENTWVIGGGTIYRQLLPFCKELHLSMIYNYDTGDVRFPIEYFNGILKTYSF